MTYVTRERARVDRIACPWLVSRFVDRNATFLFVPAGDVRTTAEREGAIPFDVPGVELGHHGERCSFDAFLATYRLDDPALRGRRWVTRPRPHVDRIASAWLIKRFVDPAAAFLFARPEEFPAEAIPFDALGAEFGHQGEDCTFETLIKRCGLRDRRLAELAEIVHEVDLRDQKYRREEARGIDLAIRGLLAALKDDQDVLAHGMTLFDGLYAALGEAKR